MSLFIILHIIHFLTTERPWVLFCRQIHFNTSAYKLLLLEEKINESFCFQNKFKYLKYIAKNNIEDTILKRI